MHEGSYLLAVFVGELAVSPHAMAADLVVEVSGIPSDRDRVGCALFASEPGLPMEAASQVGEGTTRIAVGVGP